MSVLEAEACTAGELMERLGITRQRLAALIRKGLPCTTRRGNKSFDPVAVDAWLLEHGYAVAVDPEPGSESDGLQPSSVSGPIARTYAELANGLGMRSRQAVRMLQKYAAMPGFPGRPATPGKSDGWLPVDIIREWIAALPRGGNVGAEIDDELQAIRKRIAKLNLEREEQELLTRLGRLADVEEVARFNRQCVANAKAVLEPLADEVLELLPRTLEDQVRTRIHQRAQKLLDSAWENLAQMIAGDDDRTGEDDEEGS